MPSGLDLAGVIFLVPVVDPTGAQGQFFLQILEIFVAITVGADEGASLGVA